MTIFKNSKDGKLYTIRVTEKDGIKKYREEHNPPASVIGSSIIFGFSTGTTNIIMPAIKENYYQTKLSKADDQKIDEAKLAAVLPEGYTILDNPAIRLAQAGIDLNSIINYDTGKSLAEELGVSLDVVADALRGFGIGLYTNTNVADNIYYALFGLNEVGSTLPVTSSAYAQVIPANSSLIPPVGSSYLSASIYLPPFGEEKINEYRIEFY